MEDSRIAELVDEWEHCGRVVRERMISDEDFAAVDIEIEEVKNDMPRVAVIDTAVTITPREHSFFQAGYRELDEL